MAKSRLVQIAAAGTRGTIELYAVDEAGRVWNYIKAQDKWRLLPEARETPPDPGSSDPDLQ